jgi:hypothetical protein
MTRRLANQVSTACRGLSVRQLQLVKARTQLKLEVRGAVTFGERSSKPIASCTSKKRRAPAKDHAPLIRYMMRRCLLVRGQRLLRWTAKTRATSATPAKAKKVYILHPDRKEVM